MQNFMQYDTQFFYKERKIKLQTNKQKKPNQNINSCHPWVVYIMSNYYFFL